MIDRRRFLSRGAAAATAAALMRGAPFQKSEPRKPNIVLILADDLGYSDVGCYGQERIRTPHIDQIANQGIRFTEGYAGCTVCAPSRSVLMTGLHMGHTPIRGNGMGSLLPNEVTVAEILKRAGYATGAFGKWGLGEEPGTPGVPTRKGFDEFFGYLNQNHAHRFYPEFLYHNERRYPLPGNENGKRTTYSHDVIAEKALDFIRANRDRPFFCYVPFTIPHWELLVPEDSLAEYRGEFEEKPFIDPRNHYARQNESRAAYAGMISRMDRDIGRILALLKTLGIDDDTIVFFTSDNGAAMPIIGDNYFDSTGPFRGHKGNFYEGGIRVPLIARWPGRIAAGSVSERPTAFHDFLPTLADLAGAKAPSGIDGVTIVPTLTGSTGPERRQRDHEYLYWELLRRDPNNPWQYRKEIPEQAARMGDWKILRAAPEAPVELYNLAEDIGETRNLAPKKPAVLKRLVEILTSARTPPRPPVPFKDSWRNVKP